MPDPNLKVNSLDFGPLSIEWTAIGVRTPFGVPIGSLEREIIFVTLSPITFRREGNGGFTVPGGFEFDGASIPREFWLLPGFAPCGKHLWAACGHDYLCVEAAAGRYDRVMADAWFDVILEHTGVDPKHRSVMELAVNAYRWLCRWMKWKAGQ
jgi:uncharacterized protein DUF1353